MGTGSDAIPTAEIRASTHFLWLLSAAAFLFAGVIWSGSKAHAVSSPPPRQEQEAERAKADRVALLGRLQLAGIASRRAGPPRSRVTTPKLPPPPTPASRTAHSSATWPGSEWTRSRRWCRSRARSSRSKCWQTTESRWPPATGTSRRAGSTRGCWRSCFTSPRHRPGHGLVPHDGPLEVRRAGGRKGRGSRRVSAHTTAAPSTSARSAACR